MWRGHHTVLSGRPLEHPQQKSAGPNTDYRIPNTEHPHTSSSSALIRVMIGKKLCVLCASVVKSPIIQQISGGQRASS
jgi:hypothetical protein